VAARKTFPWFWRELAWDRHRIVPAWDQAVAKLKFVGPARGRGAGDAVEFMWVDELEFDGLRVEGRLMNTPGALKGLRAGARVALSLDALSDWMLVRDTKAHGAFTVNAMRAGMSRAERCEHDAAWGLEFGAPPQTPDVKRFTARGEHPMVKHVSKGFVSRLRAGEAKAHDVDDAGWSLLHRFALAGSAHLVKQLLAHGAKPKHKTPHGLTAEDLAESLGWRRVTSVLRGR
jgi:uncharacterized protein YegJ (DUF2314 family)